MSRGPQRERGGAGRQGGFTLLELLVALTVFAVMAAIAYGGLLSMIDSKNGVEAQAARLAELQTAVTMLCRDLAQIADRPIRDDFGELMPPVSWEDGLPPQLEFTRGGFRNPAGLPRSAFRRVAYRVNDGQLQRRVWTVLDRPNRSEPYDEVLLNGVEDFSVSFLDSAGQWQDEWPVPEKKALPQAVQVIIAVEGWGRINRLVPVAAGASTPWEEQ